MDKVDTEKVLNVRTDEETGRQYLFRKRKNIRKLLVLLAIVGMISVVILWKISMTRAFSFDDYTSDTTFTDIKDMMGEPDESGLSRDKRLFADDAGKNFRFCGLKGNVTLDFVMLKGLTLEV